MKYQTILLQLIDQEIDRFLMEQAPPPPAAPPAEPTADAGEGKDVEVDDEENKMEKTIKTLASKTPIDIKKTILSSLQNGAEKADTEALVAYVKNKEEAPEEDSDEYDDEKATEEKVPENIKKAVKHIIKTFKFKVPEKAEKKAEKEEEKEADGEEEEEAPTETPAAPAAPAALAAPVKESRLQTSLREYLLYKQLSQKVRK